MRGIELKIFPFLLPFLCSLILQSKPYEKHFFSLVTQNDAYIRPMIDRYYTAGHSLMYASNEGYPHFLGMIEGETSFYLYLSQLIYTPKAKFDFIPPIGDHPYAGILGLTFGVTNRGSNVLENLGIQVGVSGKFAFGEEVQNGVHRAINIGLARGWQTQIQNEAIVNLHYDRTYRYSFFEDSPISLDLLPNFELAFGNANIYARLNALVKVGYNPSTSYLIQGVVGENGGLQTGRVYEDGMSAFAFFGIGGSYVVRKMAIEGNLFKRAEQMSLIHWTGHLQAGIALLSASFSFSYRVLYLTQEFRGQDGAHLIGSVAFSCSF